MKLSSSEKVMEASGYALFSSAILYVVGLSVFDFGSSETGNGIIDPSYGELAMEVSRIIAIGSCVTAGLGLIGALVTSKK